MAAILAPPWALDRAGLLAHLACALFPVPLAHATFGTNHARLSRGPARAVTSTPGCTRAVLSRIEGAAAIAPAPAAWRASSASPSGARPQSAAPGRCLPRRKQMQRNQVRRQEDLLLYSAGFCNDWAPMNAAKSQFLVTSGMKPFLASSASRRSLMAIRSGTSCPRRRRRSGTCDTAAPRLLRPIQPRIAVHQPNILNERLMLVAIA